MEVKPPEWYPKNIAYRPFIRVEHGQYDKREYSFDGAFDQDSTQDDVFQVVCSDLIDDLLSGINRTVLTYGQTSSGKTYTLFGPADEPLLAGCGDFSKITAQSGLLPRIVYHLFGKLRQRGEQFSMSLSYVQVYND